MTTTQLSSEQTNSSSSSKTNTESERRSVNISDEDPDSILTGRKKVEERQSVEEDADEESLSYLDALKNQSSSVWDLLSGDPLEGVDPNQVLCKPKLKKLNPRPYIAFNDLNNSDDAPYENKPMPTIEIGITFDF